MRHMKFYLNTHSRHENSFMFAFSVLSRTTFSLFVFILYAWCKRTILIRLDASWSSPGIICVTYPRWYKCNPEQWSRADSSSTAIICNYRFRTLTNGRTDGGRYGCYLTIRDPCLANNGYRHTYIIKFWDNTWPSQWELKLILQECACVLCMFALKLIQSRNGKNVFENNC